MSFGQWMLAAVLSIGALYTVWNSHEQMIAERGLLPFQDTDGFVSVTTAPGTSADQVIILAALNCPSAAAQRALPGALKKNGGVREDPAIPARAFTCGPRQSAQQLHRSVHPLEPIARVALSLRASLNGCTASTRY